MYFLVWLPAASVYFWMSSGGSPGSIKCAFPVPLQISILTQVVGPFCANFRSMAEYKIRRSCQNRSNKQPYMFLAKVRLKYCRILVLNVDFTGRLQVLDLIFEFRGQVFDLGTYSSGHRELQDLQDYKLLARRRAPLSSRTVRPLICTTPFLFASKKNTDVDLSKVKFCPEA